MELKPLYQPRQKGPMLIGGLMSGSGSNLKKIIEYERSFDGLEESSPYQMKVIFSNNAESNAVSIGQEFDIPIIVRDMRSFYQRENKPLKDLKTRELFDFETRRALQPYNLDVLAYGGYMAIATKWLIDGFLGVNVHPADMSIRDEQGRTRYIGAHVVRDAIVAGERSLRSTTHILREEVDNGPLLMRSPELEVQLPDDFNPNDYEQVAAVARVHQEKLKVAGDWIIFPKTLEAIAQGRYSQDDRGRMYFDGELIPDGVSWADFLLSSKYKLI